MIEDPGEEEFDPFAPIAAIERILGHTAGSIGRFHRAKKVLSGKDRGKQCTEHGNGSNPLLLGDVASLQQTADFLIEKKLMNLVFTGNNLCYNVVHSVTFAVNGFCWRIKPFIPHIVTLYY